MLKIDFQKSQDLITFSDAIYLPDDHTLTEADIEAMKQERFDTWLAIITPPILPVEV